ncbi:MAG: aldehyde dehydrogenase family protein [Syntrophales bacterium]
MERMGKVPFIICGRQKTGENIVLEFGHKDNRTKISLPEITDSDIHQIGKTDTESLHKLSINDIISFYSKVGELWGSPQYEKREELVDLTSRVTGYSKEMVELGMKQICGILTKEYLEATLQSDLGDKRLMDEWVIRAESVVHCQPRGKMLHILAGNVPAVAITSIVRGSLTKNANIIKMSDRDVITASYFAQSFHDVDPEHPVTKTTSVLYWPHTNHEIFGEIISLVNAVSVWGGYDAIHEMRKNTPQGVELLEFGPRRGLQLIGEDAFRDLEKASKNAAHDLTLYDQEACFSPQIAFVEGGAEIYAESLAKSLEEENAKLPKGYSDPKFHANITNARIYSKFRGHKVHTSAKTEWTIILASKMEDFPTHPLGRTIFIMPVKDLAESFNYIGPETQVVAIEPYAKAAALKEQLTLRGVDRITRLGKMGYFALESPQEGMYPLSRMVRWVKMR